MYFDLILRCIFSKQWPNLEPKVNLPLGKFSVEKVQQLGPVWAKAVDLKHPGLNLSQEPGLQTLDT